MDGVALVQRRHEFLHQPQRRIDVRGMRVVADEGDPAALIEPRPDGHRLQGPRHHMNVGTRQLLPDQVRFEAGMRDDGVGEPRGREFRHAHVVAGFHQFRPLFNRGLARQAQIVQVSHAIDRPRARLIVTDQRQIPRIADPMDVDQGKAVRLAKQHFLQRRRPGLGTTGNP